MKLSIKIFIILLNPVFSDTIFHTENSILESESKWDNSFQFGKLKYYSTLVYSESKNKFYSRFYREIKQISVGLRISDYTEVHQPNLERYFLKYKLKTSFIQVGSYKIKTGKGLSFGTDYGTSFQVESPSQLSQNNWNFNTNLSSVSNSDNSGILIGLNKNNLGLILLNDFELNKNYLFLNAKIKNLSVGLINTIKKQEYSTFVDLNFKKSKISIEILKNSFVGSWYLKKELFHYFFHFRFYNPNFTTFYGKHFKRLPSEIGEKGIISSLIRKSTFFDYSIGVELYSPNEAKALNINNIFSHYYFNLISKFNNYEFGIDYELINFSDIVTFIQNHLEFQSIQNSIYDKFGLFLKYKKSIIFQFQSNSLKNKFSNLRSYSFTVRHNGFKILNGKLKTGLTKFNVPDWEVRTFDYEPGLPGEFQLNAHNGNGIVIFSVYSISISEQSKFHFRLGFNKINSQNYKFKLGFQLNIGF